MWPWFHQNLDDKPKLNSSSSVRFQLVRLASQIAKFLELTSSPRTHVNTTANEKFQVFVCLNSHSNRTEIINFSLLAFDIDIGVLWADTRDAVICVRWEEGGARREKRKIFFIRKYFHAFSQEWFMICLCLISNFSSLQLFFFFSASLQCLTYHFSSWWWNFNGSWRSKKTTSDFRDGK